MMILIFNDAAKCKFPSFAEPFEQLWNSDRIPNKMREDSKLETKRQRSDMKRALLSDSKRNESMTDLRPSRSARPQE